MFKGFKADTPSILLLLFAVLLITGAFFISPAFVGLLGLLFIIGSSIRWGFYGGVFSSLWTAGVVAVSYTVFGGQLMNIFVSMIVCLLIGILLGKGVDINRTYQRALKEREKQVDLFFSQSIDGIFFMMLDEPIFWDETTDREKTLDYVFKHQRMTRVNQAMLDQYRAKEEDFIGLTPYDLFRHDLEHGRAIWRGLFDKGRWHVETNEKRLDGTQMWVEGDYICMYDARGRITGQFGVQTDVTARKQAEDALLQANRNMTTILEKALFGVAIIDKKRNIKWINPAALELAGVERLEEIVGQQCGEYLCPAQQNECPILDKKQKVDNSERILRRRDGRTIPILKTVIEINFDGEDVLLETFLDISQRKQAEDTLNHQLEFEKIIAEISSAFVNLPAEKIDSGINYALKLTGEFFNVDRSYVFQFSADGQTMSNTHEWCAEGIEPQMDQVQDFPTEHLPWWAEQIQSREYVYIPDVNDLPPEARAEKEEFQHQDIKSLLTVPLFKEDTLAGFFGFDSVKEKRTWAQEQASFLKVIAGTLVNAFEKKQAEEKIQNYTMELELKGMELELKGMELEKLYHQLDEEIDKARRIHERTLPAVLPEIKGISFAAHYQPAAKVGGDFYNVLHLGDRLIIYLSDVTGHGLEGALFNVFVKEAIDSFITLKEKDISPEKVLDHLDRQYRRENYPEDYFICIFLAVLDLNTMELTYSGAGFQDAPRVSLGEGVFQTLVSHGLPISSALPRDVLDFQDRKITLTPGATLLFNTDGLTEQSVNGTPYGRRLDDVFQKSCFLPPEAVIQAVNEDFQRFNNGSLQGDDDITFLVLRLEPLLSTRDSACFQAGSHLIEGN